MNNKTPLIFFILIILVCGGLGFLFWSNNAADDDKRVRAAPAQTIAPIITPTPTPPPTLPSEAETIAEPPRATALPTPSPLPLKNSDEPFKQALARLQWGKELINMLTEDEIVRKIVRAVYGVSEGRIVREHRPIDSPAGTFAADKIGKQTQSQQQELYRISPENDARYADHIAVFAMLNNNASIQVYNFLRPTFEEAFQELGIGQGNFHSTLLRAIDVLLDAPSSSQAILLIRPSVRFKFHDPTLEKLPPAHKLMLRMGMENSEALKLQLKSFKDKLEALQ